MSEVKRKWPLLGEVFGEDSFAIQEVFEEWLEKNLTKEELDRIAPIECEHSGGWYINQSPKEFKCAKCHTTIKPTKWEAV